MKITHSFISMLSSTNLWPLVHGHIGCGQKSFKLVWLYHQFLFVFLTKGHLSVVSRQSYLSANDKGDNEMISRDVHRYIGIYLTAEENSKKRQLVDRRWRLSDQSLPLMGHFPPNEVDNIAKHIRERERDGFFKFLFLGASFAVPPAPVWVPSQRHLSPSVTLVTPAS